MCSTRKSKLTVNKSNPQLEHHSNKSNLHKTTVKIKQWKVDQKKSTNKNSETSDDIRYTSDVHNTHPTRKQKGVQHVDVIQNNNMSIAKQKNIKQKSKSKRKWSKHKWCIQISKSERKWCIQISKFKFEYQNPQISKSKFKKTNQTHVIRSQIVQIHYNVTSKNK